MGIMDNEGHDPMGLGNVRSETRDKIAAARERQLAAAVAERDRLRVALTQIARMDNEDDEWDGTDKFRNVRDFAKRVIDGVAPFTVESTPT